MFDTLIESSDKRGGKRAGAFLLGTGLIYAAILLIIIIATVLAMDTELGDSLSETTMLPPSPPPAAPPPPAAQAVQTKVIPTITAFVPPKKPEKIPDASLVTPKPQYISASTGVPGGVPGGPGGVPGGIAGGRGDDAPPPPPPPPPTPEPPKQTMQRISGGVLTGKAIRRVEPRYPPIAKTARAQGAVMVQVTISEDGRVLEASVVSGHPLLREEALRAARQWVFQPTELSGVPVKVQGVLTFNFTLGQ